MTGRLFLTGELNLNRKTGKSGNWLTNLSGGGFIYAITSLSLEEILGKVI